MHKKLFITLFMFLAVTLFVASAEAATPKSMFGKSIYYGADSENTNLGDRWNILNAVLKEAENTNYDWAKKSLGQAQQIYSDYFRDAAIDVDPESNRIIEDALFYNAEYAKTKNLTEMSFNRMTIDNTINKIAYMKIEKALDEGDADTFLEWYPVMETKFGISKNTALLTNQALVEIKENPDKIHYYKNTIKSEMLKLFKNKVVSEVKKAVTAATSGKTNDAITATYVGYYQYRTLHPDLASKIGDVDAQKIESSLKSAMDTTRSGAPSTIMKTQLTQVLKTVEPITTDFLFKNDEWRTWWLDNSAKTGEPTRYNSYFGKY